MRMPLGYKMKELLSWLMLAKYFWICVSLLNWCTKIKYEFNNIWIHPLI